MRNTLSLILFLSLAAASPAQQTFSVSHFNQYQVDEAQSSLALVTGGQSKFLSFADDAYINTRATRASAMLAAPLVFVGYGLEIPEKNLDELAGLDLKGKIVVYLAGSPS